MCVQGGYPEADGGEEGGNGGRADYQGAKKEGKEAEKDGKAQPFGVAQGKIKEAFQSLGAEATKSVRRGEAKEGEGKMVAEEEEERGWLDSSLNFVSGMFGMGVDGEKEDGSNGIERQAKRLVRKRDTPKASGGSEVGGVTETREANAVGVKEDGGLEAVEGAVGPKEGAVGKGEGEGEGRGRKAMGGRIEATKLAKVKGGGEGKGEVEKEEGGGKRSGGGRLEATGMSRERRRKEEAKQKKEGGGAEQKEGDD